MLVKLFSKMLSARVSNNLPIFLSREESGLREILSGLFSGLSSFAREYKGILQKCVKKRMSIELKQCQAQSFSSILIPAYFSSSLILLAHF